MKKFLFAIALLGMAVSCTMVQADKVVLSGKHTIHVTTGDETRMAIQPAGDSTFRHVWEEGDAIVVYDEGMPLKYEVVGEGGDTKADFTGDALSGHETLYPVFYPYAECIDIYSDPTQNLFEYTFPEVIEKSAENYAQNVMIGLCDGENVQMKNCAAYIKFAFSTNIVSYVDSIKIEAIGGEPLWGKFSFGIDGSTGIPFAVPDKELSAANSVVKLNYETAEMLTSNTRSFYVALPPVELSAGLKFTFYGQFSKKPILEFVASSANLERNVVLDFEEIMTMYDVALELAPEAKVGEDEYQTLAEAFDAANASKKNCTITLLSDVYLYSSVSLNNAGKQTTLDLAGYKIKGNVYSSVTATSDLTIEDSSVDKTGQIIADGTAACAVRANGAKLTINGGTYTGTGYTSGGCGVVYSYGTGSFLTINGGKIIGTADNGRAINVTVGGKMTGGTIEAANLAIRAYNESLFTVDGEDAVIYSSGSNAPLTAASTSSRISMIKGYVFSAGEAACANSDTKVSIYGGHFNKEVVPAVGFECISAPVTGPDGRSYTYGIKELDPVAEIGSVKYSSIYLAITEANASETDCTIKLLMDISGVKDNLVPNNANGKRITIDFNDCRISGTAYFAPEGKCTFMDSGVEKKGGITNTSSYALYPSAEASDIIVNGGRYVGANQYGAIRFSGANAKMEINGDDTYVLNNKTAEGFAINVGYNASTTAEMTINGGTFVSNTAAPMRNRYGTVNIHGGVWIGATSAVVAASTRATNIDGGYFYNGTSTDAVLSGTSIAGRVSGGYFSKDIDAACLASGFKSEAITPVTKDGKSYGYQVVEDLGAPDVAMVDATGYKMFVDALEAANAATAPCTLKLLADVVADTDTLVFSNTNKVTLNLNEKRLTARITVSGKLQIEGNGTIKSPNNNDGHLIKVLGDAVLDIQNGTFTGTTSSGASKYCIFGYGSSGHRATINVNGGTITAKTETGSIRAYNADVTVNSGTITASGTYPRVFVSGSNGYFVINGGSFTGSNAIWRSSATSSRMTINGGDFIANPATNGIFYISSQANTLKITGGNFASVTTIVDAASKGVTNLTVTGGKFNQNAAASLPASAGYSWKTLGSPDATTIPGYSLTHEVVKN